MAVVIDGTGTSTFPTVDGVTMLEGSVAMPRMVLSTAQVLSGTSADFTSIPSWVKRISVMFNGVSTNGTSNPQIQIGSGSIDTTGYASAGATINTANTVTAANSTTGLLLAGATASTVFFGGTAILNLVGSNTWVMSFTAGRSDAASVLVGGGNKTLSGTLDRLRITTVAGTDTFDAGSVNILYEG